jgi:putative ABC transport system permease protein
MVARGRIKAPKYLGVFKSVNPPGVPADLKSAVKKGRSLEFSEKEVGSVDENLEAVSSETGIIEKQSTISYRTEYGSYEVVGCNPEYEKIFNLKFEQGNGRFVNRLDLEANKKVAVIDKKVQEVLFKGKNPLGENIKVGSIMFQVIGINSKTD